MDDKKAGWRIESATSWDCRPKTPSADTCICTALESVYVLLCRVLCSQWGCVLRIGPLCTTVLRNHRAGVNVLHVCGLFVTLLMQLQCVCCVIYLSYQVWFSFSLFTPVCLPYFKKVLSDVWLEVGVGYRWPILYSWVQQQQLFDLWPHSEQSQSGPEHSLCSFPNLRHMLR